MENRQYGPILLTLVTILLMGLYCLSSLGALFWVVYTSFKSNA